MSVKRMHKKSVNVRELNYATPALEKGLDVIELLARYPVGLSKSQIAGELNRTLSEIFRMLHCLERRGYISMLESERYCLTLKLFQIAQEHPPTERLITESLPVMQRFAQNCLQSCHLGVLQDTNVVILAQVNSGTSVGFYVKPGSSIDLMEAATGYVILAHFTPEQRERILAEWSRRTRAKPPRDLNIHLDRIRKTGYEKCASYQVKGIVNISFPILDNRGTPLAALTVPYIEYSTGSVSLAYVIDILRRAAIEITAAIGGKQTAIVTKQG